MGYDYKKKLNAEGQLHSNACWAASISWWLSAMSLHWRRTPWKQIKLLAEFNNYAILGGGVRTDGIRKIVESARIRMSLQYVTPAALKKDFNFGSPAIIIYNYPQAGGTHMNVVFDQQGDTVMCMEPFFPLVADKNGERKGQYIRRSLSFFANSPEVGIGCLPLTESVYGSDSVPVHADDF